MAINFPSSPITGQSYTYNNVTYVWQADGYWAVTSSELSPNYADKTLEELIPNTWTWAKSTGQAGSLLKMLDTADAGGIGLGLDQFGRFYIQSLGPSGNELKRGLIIDPSDATYLMHDEDIKFQTLASGGALTGSLGISENLTVVGEAEAENFINGQDSKVFHRLASFYVNDISISGAPNGWSASSILYDGNPGKRVTHNLGKVIYPSITLLNTSGSNWYTIRLLSTTNNYFDYQVKRVDSSSYLSNPKVTINVAY